jgi:hypothetical protein
MGPSLEPCAEGLGAQLTRRVVPWLLPFAIALSGCGDGHPGTEPGPPHAPTAGMNAGANGGQTGGGSGGRSGSGGSGETQAEGGEAGGDSSADGGTAGTALGTTALGFSIPGQGQVLSAQSLAAQLVVYDPGSLLRCDVAADPQYQAAIDQLGGVTWG